MQRSHRRPSDRRKLVLPSPPAVCVPFHRCTNFGTKGATPGGSCPLPGVRYSERFDFLLPSFSYLFTLFREALRINQSHKPKAEIVAIQVEYFFFICSFLSGQVTAETDERFAALAPFGSETSFGFTPQNILKPFWSRDANTRFSLDILKPAHLEPSHHTNVVVKGQRNTLTERKTGFHSYWGKTWNEMKNRKGD